MVRLKKKLSKTHFIILLISLALISCKKDGSNGDNTVIKGVISLRVHAMHHSWDVAGIGVYLKIHATVFPGTDTTLYEYKGKADQNGEFVFEKLLPAKYFIYVSGYDSIWGSQVIGELPVSLFSENLTSNHADVTVQVSE